MSGRIVWALSIGFLLGVLVRSLLPLSVPVAGALLMLGTFVGVWTLFDHKRPLIIAAIACMSCAGGMLRMDMAQRVGDGALTARIGESITILGEVVAEPDARERSVRLHVRARELLVGSSSVPVLSDILVLAPPHSDVAYGDRIRAHGELALPEAFDTTEGRVFNYPMFLAKDGILYQLSFAEIERTGERGGNLLKTIAIHIKRLYLSGLRRVLPEPEASLAGGITVGDKRSIGEELTTTFQTVSLVHIVVLSGYNMTVVIHALSRSLAFIPRVAHVALSGIVVALFVLMTGGAASATRAGAMALIATYARQSGRTFLGLRVLVVVALAMTLFNPYLLAFDPGFQLSILATAGLILFTPVIIPYLSFLPERYGVREIAASTIGTQVMVLPLLLYQNGLLSIVGIFANLLVLIVVPAAMLMSFIAAMSGLVFGSFGVFLALPALALVRYLIIVAETLSSLPFAAVHIPAFSAWFVLIAYVLLLVAYLWHQKKSARE